MKWGLKWMDKYSKKYREWIILLGYVGMGAGFVGLIFISYMLIQNLINLITQPTATSGVSLVLPGVNVPGLGILPFWYWLIAIFIIAVVHEFGHGIVARAHNIEVKNTGIVLFGPIIGAFVEPNEKKMFKESDIKQYSVLAAGAFSNVLLAIVAILLLSFVFSPIQDSMVEPAGFSFEQYFGESLPAEQAKLPLSTPINSINGKTIINFQEFSQNLQCLKPGDAITLSSNEQEFIIQLGENPDQKNKPFLGISNIKNEFNVKNEYKDGMGLIYYKITDWFTGFLKWLFILSLGIGLFNLLPLPIVDGGRMAQVFLHKLKGKKRGELSYRRISLFFLMILLLNLFFPLIVKLF